MHNKGMCQSKLYRDSKMVINGGFYLNQIFDIISISGNDEDEQKKRLRDISAKYGNYFKSYYKTNK